MLPPPSSSQQIPGAPQLWKIDCACYIFLQISSIYFICPKMCCSKKSLFIMKWVLYKQFSKLSWVCTTCKISQTLNCPVKSFLLEKSDALTVKGGGSENIWRPGQFLWAASQNTKLTRICEIKQKCKSEEQEFVTYWGPIATCCYSLQYNRKLEHDKKSVFIWCLSLKP